MDTSFITTYASQYTGMTKINRLKDLAKKFPDNHECKELLQKEYLTAYLVDMYKEFCEKEKVPLDEQWVLTATRETRRRLDAANTELSNAKSSSNREAIRLGYMELGNLEKDRGNFHEASRAFQSAREYAVSTQHHTDSYFKLIVCFLDLPSASAHQALTFASKIEHDDPLIKSQVKAVLGLCYMLKGEFGTAARAFADVDMSVFQNKFSYVMTASDVALYGCLCAMAQMDLPDMKRLLLESRTFRKGLEQVPYARSMLQSFCSSDFGDCLLQLKSNQAAMNMDMYLTKPACVALTEIITERILLQYCQPYSALDLRRMAAALNKELPALEAELARLIGKGVLNYRIDSANHHLQRKVLNDRDVTIEKVTALHDSHASSIRQGTLRLSLVQHNMCVVAPKSAGQTHGSPYGEGEGNMSD